MHLVQNSEGWSKNALSSELNIDRRAIDRIVKNVKPCGKKGAHNVWALRDLVIPIAEHLTHGTDFEIGGDTDPEKLKPKARKDWYDSENQRLKYEKEMGLLVPADEVAHVDAEKNKQLALTLETLADVLERDCGLEAEQVLRMNQIIDAARQTLYENILNIEIDSANNE